MIHSGQEKRDCELEHILEKCRAANNGDFGVLSTSEKLTAAVVLNRADWLEEMGYSMAMAIERIGPAWLERIPDAARQLVYEGEVERGEVPPS